MITLEARIEDVPKINKRIVPALRRLGVRTIRDLLFYFPARYDDFSNAKPIGNAVAGETVTIEGIVKKISTGRSARKKMALTQATIEDATGRMKALWFNQPFLTRNLKPETAMRFSGKVVLGKSGLFLSNPVHEKVTNAKSIHTGGLVPVYPETAGISSRWLRFLISSFLPLAEKLPDPLPTDLRNTYDLPELRDALRNIHFPSSAQDAATAERRFIFEELLLLQLRALRERSKLKQRSAPTIPADIPAMKGFVTSLPFTLTDSQRKAIWEIVTDMAKPRPMNRLLEGDVGSGKTVVAAAGAYMAAKAGYQTAVMAPTELLARQHFDTFQKILAPSGLSMGLLTGSEKHAARGKPFDITIGTHALIQKNVRFGNLGLIIVDEQHRFGVEQRAKLAAGNQKPENGEKKTPHFLSMSATPIPRTLALTVYGDLDLSLLEEMPASRKKVITRIVEPGERRKAYAFMKKEIAAGGQAFVVCPKIETGDRKSGDGGTNLNFPIPSFQFPVSDASSVKAVKQEYEKLSNEIFPDLRIAMLHGQLKPKEKKEIMERFRNQRLDMLVSTSVIEVGVDVPNATIMAIEGAERFGLSQLHQFRGRVGRGERQSYCILFPTQDGTVTQRLRAIVDAKNGFELAEYDLQIRGPGSIFGIAQSGISEISAKALRDPKLIKTVRAEAIALAKKDPALARSPLLRSRLMALESATHLE